MYRQRDRVTDSIFPLSCSCSHIALSSRVMWDAPNTPVTLPPSRLLQLGRVSSPSLYFLCHSLGLALFFCLAPQFPSPHTHFNYAEQAVTHPAWELNERRRGAGKKGGECGGKGNEWRLGWRQDKKNPTWVSELKCVCVCV